MQGRSGFACRNNGTLAGKEPAHIKGKDEKAVFFTAFFSWPTIYFWHCSCVIA
jgi:hypothetical protein